MMLRTSFCFLILATASDALAYVPSAGFLMRLLSEQRQSEKTVNLTIEMSAEDLIREENLDVRWYLGRYDRLRFEVGGAQKSIVVLNGKTVKRDKEIVSGQEALGFRLLGMMLKPPTEDIDVAATQMRKLLDACGIDTSVVSLSRLDEAIAYIIGAKPWESDKPQFWVYKHTGLPMRIVLKDDDGKMFEWRMRDYGSADGGNWFPARLEQWRDGKLIHRALLEEARVNQKMPLTLFSMD